MKLTINSLSVHVYGDNSKLPIIFVHGFPYDYSMWKNQLEKFSKDYYCITYDIRGLGKSYVGDGQYTMEAYVNDLFSIIDELNLNKPILCGLSMGGYISLRAVEKDQDIFSGLILLDTKSGADNNEGKIKRAEAINQINVEGLDNFVNGFVKNCFAEETLKKQKKMYNEVLQNSKQHNPLGVKGALFAMLSRTDTTGFLPKIKIPTLLIVGFQDNLTPPPVMRAMSEIIPEAEFGITPRAGHMTPLENPGFVNDMIKGFLERRTI